MSPMFNPDKTSRNYANPVFGGTPAVLASLQVIETVKLITGLGNPLFPHQI